MAIKHPFPAGEGFIPEGKEAPFLRGYPSLFNNPGITVRDRRLFEADGVYTVVQGGCVQEGVPTRVYWEGIYTRVYLPTRYTREAITRVSPPRYTREAITRVYHRVYLRVCNGVP